MGVIRLAELPPAGKEGGGMTHAYALRRLLEHGPCTDAELLLICGWPSDALRDALRELVAAGRVTWANVGRGMRLWMLKA